MVRAALAMLARCLRTGVRPVLTYVPVPLAISGEMSNTADEPTKGLYSTVPPRAPHSPPSSCLLPPLSLLSLLLCFPSAAVLLPAWHTDSTPRLAGAMHLHPDSQMHRARPTAARVRLLGSRAPLQVLAAADARSAAAWDPGLDPIGILDASVLIGYCWADEPRSGPARAAPATPRPPLPPRPPTLRELTR